MEKIKVTICGRDFNLVTDDSPEIIEKVAEAIEEKISEFSALKIRSGEEMLTLVALNLMCEAEKDMFAVKNVIGEMHKKIAALEEEKEHIKEDDRHLFEENMESATHELEQIAQFRDEENEQLHRKLAEYEDNMEKLMKDREIELKNLKSSFESAHKEMESIAENRDRENDVLRHKLMDYEKQLENLMKNREIELKRLNDGFDSAVKEMAYIADVKENENITLRNTLNTYETTFDNYVKLKEEEIVILREKLSELELECAMLKTKLNGDEGGQLSLYT